MEIGDSGVEQEITLDDTKENLVSEQAVTAGDEPAKDNWAYKIQAPDGRIIFIPSGVPFAPELRDANGNPLDDSVRVLFQKCDSQGNPMSEYVLNELLGRFNYEQMRTDSDYFRRTQKDLMLDEREMAKIFLSIPSGSEDFAPAESRLTIGDDTSDFGTPVEVINHGDLSSQETAAVKAASQQSGGN